MEYLSVESIGRRIESERVRLGLRNLDVCTALEIHPNTYRNYETGKRDMPSTLMSKLSTIGFDITFVLTGRRIEDLIASDDTDNVVGGSNNPPSFGNPYLIHIFNNVTIKYKEDPLLESAYELEKTFQSAGIIAREEYTFTDLIQSAILRENQKKN